VQRLRQVGVAWKDVRGVFLTHLHSDHVVGFPDLWLTGWLVGEGRAEPLDVWGPKGTHKMMAALRRAYAYDLGIRVRDDGAVPQGAVVVAHDIQPGVVYQDEGVKVTAFEVDHRPVEPAFGYRIDCGGRSVVLSGDTRLSENLIQHARGVDLLVHEVVLPASLLAANVPEHRARSVVAHHTTPEQAGDVFTRAAPRLAVYSHIVMPQADVRELVAATRKTYAGPLEVGEDLMAISVGQEIDVRRADER
jgi:ribonuclease Z